MKTYIFLAIHLALSSYSFSNDMKKSDPRMAASSGSIYWLAPNKISELSALAGNGDAAAAFRLYEYYSFSNYNKERYSYWIRVSAENGNSVAQYNLASELKSEMNFPEALYWARVLKSKKYRGADKLEREIIDLEKSNSKK